MTYPCMTPDEWAEWQEHNRVAGPKRADAPCDDCLIGFAIEMRAEGRCVGIPAGAPEGDAPLPPRRRRATPTGTDRRRAEALRLYSLGMSQAEIGRHLGVGRTTILHYVKGRRPEYGRDAVRQRVAERIREANLLRAQGLSYVAIGRRLGVSEASAIRYIKGSAA